MKKLLFFLALFMISNGCEHTIVYSPELAIPEYTVKVVGYDQNCSTCILEFPDDYSNVSKDMGKSRDNLYIAVNLNQQDYKIGEKLRVKIRKPILNELTPCKTFYSTTSYLGIYVTESEKFNNIILNDTVKLELKHCVYNAENQSYLCLDTVLSDSRCPIGAFCYIAGSAEVRFKYEKANEAPVYFKLKTPGAKAFYSDIDGYRFTMLDLKPYPSFYRSVYPKPYTALLIINRLTK
jgi:hypothetical protein